MAAAGEAGDLSDANSLAGAIRPVGTGDAWGMAHEMGRAELDAESVVCVALGGADGLDVASHRGAALGVGWREARQG